MVRSGAILLLAGITVLGGYAFFLMLRAVFSAWSGVPVILQIGVPAIFAGLGLLIAAVVRDRLQERGRERFNGVKH